MSLHEPDHHSATLLDALHQRVGCLYLSDLRDDFHLPALIDALKEIDAAAYPIEAWLEAAAYLADARKDMPTESEAARAFLLAALAAKPRK